MLSNQRLRASAAIALALGATAAPAASAKVPPPDPIYKPSPTIVRVTTPASSGFDWGDAGIGAAGGLALAMLGIGGGLAISQHRDRRSSGSGGHHPFGVAR